MKKNKEKFVHLHTHSDMSILDGCGKIDDYVLEAAERGSSAIAFAEHGTMRGFFQTNKSCEEHGIKPIFGIEFYLANDMKRRGLTDDEKAHYTKGLAKSDAKKKLKQIEEELELRKRWHVCAWAKNNEGLKNLFKLSSMAYKKGFYYKPRIDLKTLKEHGDGLAIGTGCVSGPLYERMASGKKRAAVEMAKEMYDRWGDDLWLEIQPHNMPQQKIANQFALAVQRDILRKPRLLATQDAHYIKKSDWQAHEVLLCIGTRDVLKNLDRFRFSNHDFYMKTRREMWKSFLKYHDIPKKQIKSALNNTMLLASQMEATLDIDYHAAILPEIDIPVEHDSEWQYLLSLCKEGWKWRNLKKRIEIVAEKREHSFNEVYEEYRAQLKHELKLIRNQNFISYFLLVRDLYQFVREKKIMCGPGRGSASASLVAFLLGITSVDPLAHNLLFERFIGEGRCFPKGTSIKTKNGWKNIEDIESLKDEVKTRRGYRRVLDRLSRVTDEDLVRVECECEGIELILETTPNHIIYHYLNGEIKPQRASDIKVDQELCFEKSYLHYLQKSVRENSLEQANVFKKMCFGADIKRKKNRKKTLPALQEKIYGATMSKVLLKEMWSFSKFWQNKKQGQNGFSKRYRTFCPIIFRSRFCEIPYNKRRKISIRTENDNITKQHNIHSRFLCERFGMFHRVKGLERARQREIEESSKIFREEIKSILLRSGFRTIKKDATAERHEVRTIGKDSVSRFQNSKENLSRVQREVSSTCHEATSIQSVQPKLCKCKKIQRTSSGENKETNKRTSAIVGYERKRNSDKKTRGKNVYSKNSNSESEIKNVIVKKVTIVKTRKSIEVYDLCVDTIHEYFANGFLVKNSDLPDIDMDFEDARRGEIVGYLTSKYGKENVSQIATVGKLSGKQCLKDVSRVLSVPYNDVNEVTGSIIERAKGDERVDKTIEDSFKESAICRRFDKKYPDVKEYAIRLEGMAKTLGVHAAGVVVTPKEVHNYIPLETRKNKDGDVTVTALDKKGCAALGLVKLDVLGLKTLTVIRDCIEAVEKKTGQRIDPETDILLDDKEVLERFTAHDYVGVFQFDSQSAHKTAREVVFESFDDIVALNAINRPGTTRSGLVEQWRERKVNPRLRKALFGKTVENITQDTLGVIVYQEHVIRILKQVGRFSASEADKLRKAIGASEGAETIEKERSKFVKGAIKSGLDEKVAEKLMNVIAQFGGYSFNKAHATSYAMIAFWTMYFKTYHPLEFYWASMKNEDKQEKIQKFARDAEEHGILLLPPDVSISDLHFVIDYERNAIRGSLMDIKNVGEKASMTIIQNQPYKNFIDFLSRIDRRKCHKGVVASLAKAGALDDLLPNVKWFIENTDEYWQLISKKGVDSKESKVALIKSLREPDFDEEEKLFFESQVNPLALGGRPINAYKKFVKKNITVPIVSPGAENFFKKYHQKGVYILGTIANTKIIRVGDYHVGEEPSDVEKVRMRWGAQSANVNIDCSDGASIRVKFGEDTYPDFQPIIDSGTNTALLIHAVPNEKYQNFYADYAIKLEDLKHKLRDGVELNLWEKIATGKHPALTYKWKNEETKKRWVKNTKFKFGKKSGYYCGVVTHVRTKIDRKGGEMAFFGLQGVHSHLEAMCFASHWLEIRKIVKIGNLVILDLSRQGKGKDGSYMYDGGFARQFKSISKK